MASELDLDYLEDLRDGIGDAALGELIDRAPISFTEALDQLRLAWRNDDRAGIEDHAHRLKGAAASIGCRDLAQAALRVMLDPTPDARIIAALDDLAARSARALRTYLGQRA